MFRHILLGLLLCAAPVPKHLQPPPPQDEVKPGYRWYFQDEILVVHETDGDKVTFRNLSSGRTWHNVDGFAGPNMQSRARVKLEAATYGVPPTY